MTASMFVAAAASYHAEIRALFGLLALRVDGTIDLEVDHDRAVYRLAVAGLAAGGPP